MKKVAKGKSDLLPLAPLIITLLALIAVVLSAYLAWSTWHQQTLLGCGGEGANCEEVTETRWGKWFGIPVSAPGVLVYSAIFFLSLSMRKHASRIQWLALIFFSVLASASALWFIGLQIFEIKSYCYYCMAIHACGLTIALIVFNKAPLRRLSSRLALTSILAGVGAVAVIAAGQLYAGRNLDVQQSSVTELLEKKPQVSEPQEIPAHREVILAKGKLWFSLGDFPFIGRGDATNFVAHFFDYTCPACRQYHSTLRNTHQTYINETTLVMIPVPLDAACNSAVKETAYVHQDACMYAEIGLALWRVSPQSYESYDQFIFQDQLPPSIEAARGLADHLAGKDAMDRALANPEMMTVLHHGLEMFYSRAFPQKAIPALVTKNEVFSGFTPPDLLTRLMTEH
ncbi:thioredoxin domain-containing protein [bacterium]|nr:thioredoxin domain-containing protein [bacterium]